MRAVECELFKFGGGDREFCCIILDCSYLELIKLEKAVPRPNINSKKDLKTISRLIIGVTKPNGDFAEIKATINMVSPLSAKGSFSIDPSDKNLVSPNSKIELLRYELFPKE